MPASSAFWGVDVIGRVGCGEQNVVAQLLQSHGDERAVKVHHFYVSGLGSLRTRPYKERTEHEEQYDCHAENGYFVHDEFVICRITNIHIMKTGVTKGDG